MYHSPMKTEPRRVHGTSYLPRPGGSVAYDLSGDGPLVVLVPGMGDLRLTYRFVAPTLREMGYRVACTDLRGHGDSDVTFGAYGDSETAGDVAALIEHLGGPAVIVGNSMGAAAASLVTATHPELVAGLVLIGPFVRNPQSGVALRLLMRAAMAPPWAALVWKSYLPKLYAGERPADFELYRQQVAASLRRRGYSTAFSRTTRTSHAGVDALLGDVTVPAMVVMGMLDPDFSDPQAEADWIAHALGVEAEVVMVPEAGHYPQSQRPEITADAIVRFLAAINHRA